MKNIVIGITAHVDAGKTTLTEAMLYTAGVTQRLGRVDKGDAYLDTYALEKERGITIFSKQAVMDYGDTHFTLVDTPGHIDFSCEAERAMAVQDYCILLVSATDGVHPHTKTLWQLLEQRNIPTFIFVNKTDISDRISSELLAELQTVLSKKCVSFQNTSADEFYENVASLSEDMIDEYFKTGSLSQYTIAKAIKSRDIFPCFFGSALKNKGIKEILSAIDNFTLQSEYSKTLFGARVYKIMHDESGRRISFAKITGGTLKPKDVLNIPTGSGYEEEKVEELRVFSADKSKPLKEALPGTICAIYGPNKTYAGMGIGIEASDTSSLTPVLDYSVILPSTVSPTDAYVCLSKLSEEDPALALKFNSQTGEIRLSLMGEIQLEVLTRLVKERFGFDIKFSEGEILYKESILNTVYGSGHFEPLRHYAEVHLRIEPGESDGIITSSDCDRDTLALNWQRLIITHVGEKQHRGVLIGAPITNLKISIVGGRAHLKHTEGGDFREATYRAIRQGLMKAESVILEPTFDFSIQLPNENAGRLIQDISTMHGEITEQSFSGDTVTIEGYAPVSTMRSYPTTLRAYTRGAGKITLNVGKYVPAHNPDEIIARYAYDPELDERNSPHSVFCKAGSGYSVHWSEADALMHALPGFRKSESEDTIAKLVRAQHKDFATSREEDKELMRIFEATYGKIKRKSYSEKKVNEAPPKPPKHEKPHKRLEELLIIDGYNVIFAWEELHALAKSDFSLGRDTLIRIMCNYSAYRKCKCIVVFDAYKRKDNQGSTEVCGNTTVVYTKEGETADAYIEKTTADLVSKYQVRVVTSDMQEQYMVLGSGALRVSVSEFKNEIESTNQSIKESIELYKKVRK